MIQDYIILFKTIALLAIGAYFALTLMIIILNAASKTADRIEREVRDMIDRRERAKTGKAALAAMDRKHAEPVRVKTNLLWPPR